MRSQTYGDKQREAQSRKKQEALQQKKSNAEGAAAETPKADESNLRPKKEKKKNTADRRSS